MLNWGIISTGRIASVFAKGLAASNTGRLAAIASRSQSKADRFGLDADHWGDFLKNSPHIKRYGSYEALLADPQIHAVYIATPHPQHLLWTCRAAEAKKHILCEKPLAMNHADAVIACESARKNNVFLMEAFMYRCHPLIAKIVELLHAHALGQVRSIQANFSYNAPTNYESRVLSNALGGGGILDVGCYPTSFARLVAGAAFDLHAPAEPADGEGLKALGHLGPTGVDEYTAAVLKFINPADPSHEIIAHLATGVQVQMDNSARIYGSAGSIVLHTWVPRETNQITLLKPGQEPREISADPPPGITAYTLEADVLAHAVNAGQLQASFPAMSWADTLGNMKTLDAWRRQINLTYHSEKPGTLTTPS